MTKIKEQKVKVSIKKVTSKKPKKVSEGMIEYQRITEEGNRTN